MGGHAEASAAEAGVCDPADRTTNESVSTPPAMRLRTGTAKTIWTWGRSAINTQQIGMDTASTRKAHDAMATHGPATGKLYSEKQNSTLPAPRTKKAKSPSRYNGRM